VVLFAVLRVELCCGSSQENVITTVTAKRSCHRLQRRVSHSHVIAPLPPDITGMWISKRGIWRRFVGFWLEKKARQRKDWLGKMQERT
ncbi:hypothetical protein LSAT2_027139, partial [Lamellibrachia satsuma]